MTSSDFGQSTLFQDTVFIEKELTKSVWTRLVKKRDNQICQYSLNDPFRKHYGPVEVHHIQPSQYGGKFIVSNGITLCKKCHAQFLIEAEQKYYSGVLQKYYLIF